MQRVGKMTERVVIQQEHSVPDGAGGYALSWVDIAMVWAEVKARSGREAVQQGGVRAAASYTITVRYRMDLREGLRLAWVDRGRERYLNINSVLDLAGDRQFHTIEAEEGVAT